MLNGIFTQEKFDLIPEERVFTSLYDVPLDEIPDGYSDGDNSLLVNYTSGLPFTDHEMNLQRLKQTQINDELAKTANRVVVLPRLLELKKTGYLAGKDVLALQRALAVAGVRKWGNFTGIFGEGTKKNIQNLQQKVHLKTDGVYGLETHKKLARHYDSYGAFLMAQAQKTLSPDPVEKLLAYATFGYNNRYKIHYTQSPLRMYGVKHKVRPPAIPYYEDCSSFATWCYWGAGLKDPNNLGYNGFGYTGTLALNGKRTTDPKPGNLAFYGIYPYSHVTVYIGNGRCISHGSEIGPLLVSVWYRTVSQFRTYI